MSDVVDRLALSVVTIAQRAETDIVTMVGADLAQGVESSDWARRKASEIPRLRASWEKVVDGYVLDSRTAVGDALIAAGEEGETLAAEALKDALRSAPTRIPGAGGVVALAEEVSGLIASTRFGVLRMAEDSYRSVISEVLGSTLLGTMTRRQIAQRALNRMAAAGIGGFVDGRGRRWELASYVEMATRTGVQRAMTQAHTETLQGNGVNLVMISDAPQECKLCRPWENKILSLSGDGETALQLPSVKTGSVVTVKVAGSLDEAKRAGLFHPNCRHSFKAYFPGLTRSARSAPADPQGDEDRQKLRALERQLRSAKRVQAVAMDEPARRAAAAEVSRIQARIRSHVETTTAKRQPQREQIGRAR